MSALPGLSCRPHFSRLALNFQSIAHHVTAFQLAHIGVVGYFARDGGVTAGPLLFPVCPGILDESCWRTARLWSLMSEPVVSPEGFTAGPLLLPGLPGIPAPEFCPLGALTWPPPEGAVVCAAAGNVTIASAIAPISNFNMANSLRRLHLSARNDFADQFVPEQQPGAAP
jgi:hypothetical protein